MADTAAKTKVISPASSNILKYKYPAVKHMTSAENYEMIFKLIKQFKLKKNDQFLALNSAHFKKKHNKQ